MKRFAMAVAQAQLLQSQVRSKDMIGGTRFRQYRKYPSIILALKNPPDAVFATDATTDTLSTERSSLQGFSVENKQSSWREPGVVSSLNFDMCDKVLCHVELPGGSK